MGKNRKRKQKENEQKNPRKTDTSNEKNRNNIEQQKKRGDLKNILRLLQALEYLQAFFLRLSFLNIDYCIYGTCVPYDFIFGKK